MPDRIQGVSVQSSAQSKPSRSHTSSSPRVEELKGKVQSLHQGIGEAKKAVHEVSDAVKTDLKSQKRALKTEIKEDRQEIRESRREIREEKKEIRKGQKNKNDSPLGSGSNASSPPSTSTPDTIKEVPSSDSTTSPQQPTSSSPDQEYFEIQPFPGEIPSTDPQVIVSPPTPETSTEIISLPSSGSEKESQIPAPSEDEDQSTGANILSRAGKRLSALQQRGKSFSKLGDVLEKQVSIAKDLQSKLLQERESGIPNEKIDDLIAKLQELDVERDKLTKGLSGKNAPGKASFDREALLQGNNLQKFVEDREKVQQAVSNQQGQITQQSNDLKKNITATRSQLATQAASRYQEVESAALTLDVKVD